MLVKAIKSVLDQEHQITQLSVVIDTEGLGAGSTRNRAKNALNTEWTCFLDDDDVLYPNFVSELLVYQQETQADLVFPWFDCTGADPFPQFEGLPWDDGARRMFPITVLVRTSVAQSVDFPEVHGEDWLYWNALLDGGAAFAHLNKRLWCWNHHGKNMSGRSWKDPASTGAAW